MKRRPMQLEAQPPYYIDLSDPGYIDDDGFASKRVYEMPLVTGWTIRGWLNNHVLPAVLDGDAGGNVARQKNEYRVSSPAGDLHLCTDPWAERVHYAKFTTASALVGQAAVYRLQLPNPADYSAPTRLETIERGGQNLAATFDELYLFDRDPIAIRLVEMVDLVRANATPNPGALAVDYLLAA
jgi:hypothetical protein